MSTRFFSSVSVSIFLQLTQLVFFTQLLGCGCSKKTDTEARAEAARVVPAPANLTADFWLSGGGPMLDALRKTAQDPTIASGIPRSMAALAERASIPEAVAKHIPANANLFGVLVRKPSASGTTDSGTTDSGSTQPKSAAQLLAFPVTLEQSDAHPLGVETTLTDGAPLGARWVRSPSDSDSDSNALLGIALYKDILVLAKDTADLEASLPYLQHRVHSQLESGLHINVVDGVLSRGLRESMEEIIQAQAAEALADAQAEKAQHADAPSLGDPDSFIRVATSKMEEALAYLPDVGAAHITVLPSHRGLEIAATVDAHNSSPLQRKIAAWPTASPNDIAAMPDEAALVLFLAGANTWLAGDPNALSQVAGDRLSTEERARLADGVKNLGDAFSGALTLGFGVSAQDGPWAIGVGAKQTNLDRGAFLSMWTIPYVQTLMKKAFQCPEDSASKTNTHATHSSHPAHAANTPSAMHLKLCEVTPSATPTFHWLSNANHHALMWSHSETANVASTEAMLATWPSSGTDNANNADTLGNAPDTERALGSMDGNTLGALWVSPSRLPSILGLFPSETTTRITQLAQSRAAEGAKPTLVALSRTDAGLKLHLIMTPGAVDQWFKLALLGKIMIMSR